MEFFRNTNIDFLGKKWYFLAFSLIFSVAGVLSMLFWHGIPWGVDFRGGTLVTVKFCAHRRMTMPSAPRMDRADLRNAKIQRYGQVANNEVLIDLDVRETSEQALDQGKIQIIKALETNAPAGKTGSEQCQFFDNQELPDGQRPAPPGFRRGSEIRRPGPGHRGLSRQSAGRGAEFARPAKGAPGVDPAVAAALGDGFFLSDFGVRDVAIVGPQVGAQLRQQAGLATLYSLAGMLVYLGFRFEWIYGVAAVVTVFHDTLITVGAFSLTES